MKKYNVEVDTDGSIFWYNEAGQLHREDGPAEEWDDGDRFWYINGKLHREDGPAFEDANGACEWWINGLRHREDGPAVEWRSGIREWYIDGKLHREDGPAIEDGSRRSWFINGESLTEEEFNNRNKKRINSL